MGKRVGLISPGKKKANNSTFLKPPNAEAFDLDMLSKKPWRRPFSHYDPVVTSKAIASNLQIAPCSANPETEYSLYAGRFFRQGETIHIIGTPTLTHQQVCDLVVEGRFRSGSCTNTNERCRHIHEFATLDKMPDVFLNDPRSRFNMFCDLSELRDPVNFLQSASSDRGNRDKINCKFHAMAI